MTTATGRPRLQADWWRADRQRVDKPAAYRAAAAGTLPAEALTPNDRRILVTELVYAGLTDLEIAIHTRWTTYTTVRIRESIYLPPNPERSRDA
ncbi:hypothetical protein [Nocardia salmonicida]|uniref:hypothetical protein n=1 Tax=Nocardia salmonicida TaxID=53431 RepID=UPI0036349E48